VLVDHFFFFALGEIEIDIIAELWWTLLSMDRLLNTWIPWKNTSYVVLSHILFCQTCTLTFESWPMCIGFKFPLFIPMSNITQSCLCTLLVLTFLAPREWVYIYIPTSQIAFLVSIHGTKCIIHNCWSLIS
jgi:hypothetical protein